mgnify:CR=1 FL=1
MLLNVLREQAPEYVVVAFDVGKTFRHEMYDAYKGHRERMPDELRDQVERIKEVVDTLNIPVFTADGSRVETDGVDLFTFSGGKIALKNSFRKTRPNLPAAR